jgi:hypothetical protein
VHHTTVIYYSKKAGDGTIFPLRPQLNLSSQPVGCRPAHLLPRTFQNTDVIYSCFFMNEMKSQSPIERKSAKLNIH